MILKLTGMERAPNGMIKYSFQSGDRQVTIHQSCDTEYNEVVAQAARILGLSDALPTGAACTYPADFLYNENREEYERRTEAMVKSSKLYTPTAAPLELDIDWD